MKEVVGQTDRGKQLLNELMDGINKMFNDQDYEESVSRFREDLEDVTDDTNDDDLDDFLSSLGIRKPDDEE